MQTYSMIAAWIESLLPGARNLRPPLISGMLWAFVLWIAFSEAIPLPAEAHGWAAQAYTIAAAAGTVPTALVLSVLIWAGGVLSMAATNPAGSLVGALLLGIRRQVTWQRHVRRSVDRLRKELSDLQSRRVSLQDSTADSGQKELAQLQRQIEDKTGRLAKIRQSTRHAVLVMRNSSAIAAVGDPAPDRTSDLAEQIVEGAAQAAIDAALDKTPQPQAHSIRTPNVWEIQEAFVREFEPDPIDAIRGLDETLYLELDRERSEREVRLAISPPLAAIGALGAVSWSPWYVVVSILGVLLFLKTSIAQSGERSRIMKLVSMRCLETPALRAAAAAGREAVRRHVSDAERGLQKP